MSRPRSFGKVLGISTSFPTVEGTSVDGEDVLTVDPGKTKSSVEWPDNWSKLSPRWRAVVAVHLVRKVLSLTLNGDEETYAEFKKLTGWGGAR